MHQAELLASEAPRRLLIAGVGAGKTQALVIEAVRNCLCQPGVDGLIMAPTYTLLERVILPTWDRIVPAQFSRFKARAHTICTVTGNTIYLLGADRARARIVGLNVGWALVDEVTANRDPQVMAMAQQRCRVGRDLHVSAFSSPRATTWAQEWAKTADVIRATTYDNPYLPAAYVANVEADFPPGTLLHRQEMLGEFVSLTGRIYGELFVRERHLCGVRFDPDKPFWLGWDFGLRASAVVVVQQALGAYVVVREILPSDEFTEDTAYAIQRDYGTPRAIYSDTPSKQNTRTGITDVQAVREVFGPRCELHVSGGVVRGRDWRHKAVAIGLARNRILISRELARERPRPNERGLVHALETLEWPRESTRDERVDERDPRKHVVDALEFFCAAKLPPKPTRLTDAAFQA